MKVTDRPLVLTKDNQMVCYWVVEIFFTQVDFCRWRFDMKNPIIRRRLDTSKCPSQDPRLI